MTRVELDQANNEYVQSILTSIQDIQRRLDNPEVSEGERFRICNALKKVDYDLDEARCEFMQI